MARMSHQSRVQSRNTACVEEVLSDHPRSKQRNHGYVQRGYDVYVTQRCALGHKTTLGEALLRQKSKCLRDS